MGRIYGYSDKDSYQEISLEMLDWPYYDDEKSMLIKLPDFIRNKLVAMMEIKNFDFMTILFIDLDQKILPDFTDEWLFSLPGNDEFYFLHNSDRRRDREDLQILFESRSIEDWKRHILKDIQKEEDRLLSTAREELQKARDNFSYQQKIFKKISLALLAENPI